MASYDDLRKAGRLTRRSRTATVSATLATATRSPLLPSDPDRVSFLIVNGGSNAGRIAHNPGLLSTTTGVPIAATDGYVSEHFESHGDAVKDPVYALMETGDQTVYIEEVVVSR